MEIVISIGIISFAFVGVMAVFASNIRAEMLSRDRITAAYLAQEGVEIVKQRRDTNWFSDDDKWDDGIDPGNKQTLILNNTGDLSSGWKLVNANDDNEQIFLMKGNTYVQADGDHRPSSWESTKFRRVISITKAKDRIKVAATVYYGEDKNSKVRVVSYLFNNWYKK